MTRRDWAHLVGWLALTFLLFLLHVSLRRHDTTNQSVVALAAATKALEKTAAMESQIEYLERENEGLRAKILELEAYWETLSRETDRHKLEGHP